MNAIISVAISGWGETSISALQAGCLLDLISGHRQRARYDVCACSFEGNSFSESPTTGLKNLASRLLPEFFVE